MGRTARGCVGVLNLRGSKPKYPIRVAFRSLHLRTYHILRVSVAQDQIIINERELTLGVLGRIAFPECKRELMRDVD